MENGVMDAFALIFAFVFMILGVTGLVVGIVGLIRWSLRQS